MSSTGSAPGTKAGHHTRGARPGRSEPAPEERTRAAAPAPGLPDGRDPNPSGPSLHEELPRPPRDKFEIFVHPHGNTHIWRICHPFSLREKPLKEGDGAQVVRFIAECMPSRREPPAFRRELPPEPPVQPISGEGVVKEVEVVQGEHRASAPRIALRPRVPFSVTVRIGLKLPPGDRIPFNVPDYTVRLVARRPDAAGKTEECLAVGTLVPGQSEYESHLDMPALPPGRYVLDAYARVPYASIAECERAELQVG